MTTRFRLLLAGRTISMLGNAFGPIALAFGVLALPSATPSTLSIVLAAQAVPQVGLLLLGGVIGDRFPRYGVLIVAEVTAGAAYSGLAAMLLIGYAPTVLLAACAFVTGTATALALPSLSGAVTEVVPRNELQRANARLRLGLNAARIAGLALAGVTVAVLGPGVALAVDAATYFAAAVLFGLVRLPPSARTRARSLAGDLRAGWRAFASRSWLWPVVSAAAFINVGSLAGFTLLGPVLTRERGAIAWSIVLIAYAFGMVAGVAVAMRVRPPYPLVTALAMTPVLALPLIALGLGSPLPLVAAAAFASGVAMDVFGVLWETTVQHGVPSDSLSRVNSYEQLCAHSLKPAGMLGAGVAAESIGGAATMILLSAVMIVAGLAALAVPAVRNHPRHLSGEGAAP